MGKENVMYVHKSSIQPYGRMKLCHLLEKWMQLELIILSDISQTLKDKSYAFSLLWIPDFI